MTKDFQLLISDCLKANWGIDDFFHKFNDSDIVDPFEVLRKMECLIMSKQVEEMFENHKRGGVNYGHD